MTAHFLALYETPTGPEAFDRHYREVHIPLGLRLPGLLRYAIGRDAAAVRGAPRSPRPRAGPPPPTRHACRSSPRSAA
jgi:uncharacterized protein (TIGR02118 family)